MTRMRLWRERFGISIWIIIHRLYILGIYPPSILTYGPFRRRWRPVGFIWIEFYTPRDLYNVSILIRIISRTLGFISSLLIYILVVQLCNHPPSILTYGTFWRRRCRATFLRDTVAICYILHISIWIPHPRKKLILLFSLYIYITVVSLLSYDGPDEALLYFVLTTPVWRRGSAQGS